MVLRFHFDISFGPEEGQAVSKLSKYFAGKGLVILNYLIVLYLLYTSINKNLI